VRKPMTDQDVAIRIRIKIADKPGFYSAAK
jgi:hypothetical protein